MEKKLVHLQVKIASLASEVRIIRNKELKWRDRARSATLKMRQKQISQDIITMNNDVEYNSIRDSLYQHRRELTPEIRAANIAQAFLLGKPYQTVERKIRANRLIGGLEDVWNRVIRNVLRFGKYDITDKQQLEDVRKQVLEWRNQHQQFVPNKHGIVTLIAAE